eukprot:CAMPEP_0194442096 /NCGR_PEP_ID=MMETSP0176-20130528/125033_1 /TAXON_ID=216777 /ORGANISM="Proboscia alata, Strain PI-D3" /LENGTH=62 /DNA_ID=CAMNT_0039267993 /DNA_START=218 /DNA_END=403 /DNA_ORIENTATION=+
MKNLVLLKERRYQVPHPSESQPYTDGSDNEHEHAIVSVTTDPAEDDEFGSYYVLFSNGIIVC